MAEDPVELTRKAAGEFAEAVRIQDLRRWAERWFSPELRYTQSYRGRRDVDFEVFVDGLERFFYAFDELRADPEEYEYTPIGENRVLMGSRFSGRGKESGAEVEARFYDLYTFREDKVVAGEQFLDRDAALARARELE